MRSPLRRKTRRTKPTLSVVRCLWSVVRMRSHGDDLNAMIAGTMTGATATWRPSWGAIGMMAVTKSPGSDIDEAKIDAWNRKEREEMKRLGEKILRDFGAKDSRKAAEIFGACRARHGGGKVAKPGSRRTQRVASTLLGGST